jgi:predicted nucleotidyltransferase
MTNFDIIRNDGRLLYEYIRGSHLYGLNNEDSDVDTSGVFVCTRDELFGCFGYKPQVTDARHDNTWFEIGELIRLLLKSNPTVMESLLCLRTRYWDQFIL